MFKTKHFSLHHYWYNTDITNYTNHQNLIQYAENWLLLHLVVKSSVCLQHQLYTIGFLFQNCHIFLCKSKSLLHFSRNQSPGKIMTKFRSINMKSKWENFHHRLSSHLCICHAPPSTTNGYEKYEFNWDSVHHTLLSCPCIHALPVLQT